MPEIGVLALQGDVREHVRMLQEAGAESRPVRGPAELDAVDALVVPGGESTTMWKLADTFELLEPLRMRIKDGMPAYGSCAGMIMLADRIEDGVAGQQTFGGIDMVVRRNAFGRQVDSFEADLDFAGAPVHAVFIRAPWVESIGPGVDVLGRAEPGDRIVAVRQGPLLATSFHPELTGDTRVHRYFVDMVREL
ncbi:pyridoxal 5'-phosphate synthase glutaminase subunit PdxT [Nonomuraea sp. MCN248]|uniref:Pyridoxal 5'-phosphate synthase subunit PdxT n=1 Tax=Nonomuraea corallina TaxID=2989783 RepID=A0ABT4SF04_9ACTN|nr:pyridoxal 5'-phosphate synthase glutaminase subunit PdxT [Nonomuraea corallina]